MEVKGIDVSRYQGTIDWAKVKKAGVKFAMLRCGTGYGGGTKDTKFETNYKNAKAQGIAVGAYFYTYAKNKAEAEKDAYNVLKWIKGKQFEYPIAYDVEDNSIKNLGMAVISENIKTFCEILEKAGYYVSVYANKDWLVNRIDADCKKKYDTWLAQWNNKVTYDGSYGMWQYTSSGKVDGINGNCDLDYAYQDYPSIMKKNGLNGFKKSTTSGANSSTETVKVIKAGDKLTFKNKDTYFTSTSTKSTKRTGTFYVYDGKKINGRYRITNSPSRIKKKPIFLNVTCWAKL